MFCGELPCQCSQTTSKTSTASASKAKKPSSNGSANRFAARQSNSSPAPQSTDFSANPFVTQDRFAAKIASQEESDETTRLEEAAALRVLRPLLSKADQKKYDEVVNPKLSPELFRRRGEVKRNLHHE